MEIQSARVSKHASTYMRYFVVGGLVGILTIALRELFAWLLPADTPVYYAVSVILAYAVGIVCSYYGHHNFTFNMQQAVGGHATALIRFTFIAVTGMLATTVTAMLIRYGFPVDRFLGQYAGGVAFALATFMASLVTYSLNSAVTFKGHGKG